MARVWLGDVEPQAQPRPEPPDPGTWVCLGFLAVVALVLLWAAERSQHGGAPSPGGPSCSSAVLVQSRTVPSMSPQRVNPRRSEISPSDGSVWPTCGAAATAR
jgi:hypothetical protein